MLPATPQPNVTRILHAIDGGDRRSVNRLLAFIYGEPRSLADVRLAHERVGFSLQATAFVLDGCRIKKKRHGRLVPQVGSRFLSRYGRRTI